MLTMLALLFFGVTFGALILGAALVAVVLKASVHLLLLPFKLLLLPFIAVLVVVKLAIAFAAIVVVLALLLPLAIIAGILLLPFAIASWVF